MNECTLYSNVERYLSDGKGIAVKTTGSGREGNIADGFHRELIPLDPENLKPQFAETEDGFCLIEPITPPERMIILGGGPYFPVSLPVRIRLWIRYHNRR